VRRYQAAATSTSPDAWTWLPRPLRPWTRCIAAMGE
jgi:hypothetical protein